MTPGLALAALYVLSVVLYAVLGHRNAIPSIMPDEFTYGHLARSVADGEGLHWRGEAVPLRAALYVYAIAPAWLGSSTTAAYTIAKVIGAGLCGLVVVPTWLLARRSVGPWLAFVPAGLAVGGTWMLVAAGILTENLAYPLGVAALAAIVVAVQRPQSRWPWVAIALVVLAAATRSQLAVLLPVLPIAALGDALRAGRLGLSAGLRRQQRTLVAGGSLAVLVIIAAAASPHTVLGTYAGLRDYTPSLGSVLAAAGRHAVGLVAMAGLLPAILVITLTVLRSAWEDDELGPMLAVFWVATVVLMLEVAWYMAGTGFAWHVERYVMYVLPLGLTIAVAGIVRIRPGWRPIAAVSIVVGGLMLLAAPLRNISEEEGVFGIFRPVHGVLGTSAPVSLALATIVVGLVAAALARHAADARASSVAAALAMLTIAVFAVQDVAAWSWRLDAVREVRADRPSALGWLDHVPGGPVGRIVVAANPPGAPLTEFFNRGIASVYIPAPEIGTITGPVIHGRTCTWNAAADGVLALGPDCGPVPNRFLLDDQIAKLTLAGQRIVVNEPEGGRVVAVTGPPRILALVFVPCGVAQFRIVIGGDGVPRRAGRTATCTPSIRGNLWLDRPGRLVLRFRGGVADHAINAGGRTTTIPAGGSTTVVVPAPARPTAFEFQLDWTGSGPQFPRLEAFDLVRGSERLDLIGVEHD